MKQKPSLISAPGQLSQSQICRALCTAPGFERVIANQEYSLQFRDLSDIIPKGLSGGSEDLLGGRELNPCLA